MNEVQLGGLVAVPVPGLSVRVGDYNGGVVRVTLPGALHAVRCEAVHAADMLGEGFVLYRPFGGGRVGRLVRVVVGAHPGTGLVEWQYTGVVEVGVVTVLASIHRSFWFLADGGSDGE